MTPGCPQPVAPIGEPVVTTSPFFTAIEESHEYVVRTPSGWSMEMKSDPATEPANATVPSSGAAMTVP